MARTAGATRRVALIIFFIETAPVGKVYSRKPLHRPSADGQLILAVVSLWTYQFQRLLRRWRMPPGLLDFPFPGPLCRLGPLVRRTDFMRFVLS